MCQVRQHLQHCQQRQVWQVWQVWQMWQAIQLTANTHMHNRHDWSTNSQGMNWGRAIPWSSRPQPRGRPSSPSVEPSSPSAGPASPSGEPSSPSGKTELSLGETELSLGETEFSLRWGCRVWGGACRAPFEPHRKTNTQLAMRDNSNGVLAYRLQRRGRGQWLALAPELVCSLPSITKHS